MSNGDNRPVTPDAPQAAEPSQDPKGPPTPPPEPEKSEPLTDSPQVPDPSPQSTPDPVPADPERAEPPKSVTATSSAERQTSAGDQPSDRTASNKGRGLGPLAARGLGVAKPASPAAKNATPPGQANPGKGKGKGKDKRRPLPRLGGQREKPAESTPASPPAESVDEPVSSEPTAKSKPSGVAKPAAGDVPASTGPRQRVAVPNLRQPLSDDLMLELEAELGTADVEGLLAGGAGMPDRAEPLGEGARVSGQVLKIHEDSVFIGLGGPDEGVMPLEQFSEQEPVPGQAIEVLVRGFNGEDGLYVLTLPGQAIEVSDWDDIEDGSVVEATVTGHNSGGLEAKVGNIRGFIPISQVTEYRVEDLSEFVDQRLVCLVTESNPRRGNLVLSRRAILEREREQRRKEQLEKIEVGDELEGIVRSVKDFGAFVDVGGLDGLIHISKLSWDRIKHPSEVLEEGQQVQVKVEKLDKQTGKMSLSYRDLLENPWDDAEASFAVGSIHKGTVTRIANFGCFVRLSAGVEGLVHISELANHRVSRVDSVVDEGQEIEVKVMSFDRESQKIGLSVKAAQSKAVAGDEKPTEETVEPPREPVVKRRHEGPLKGGNNTDAGGERFGLRW